MLPGPTTLQLSRIVTVIAIVALTALLAAFVAAFVGKFIPNLNHWSGAPIYIAVLLSLVGVFVLCIVIGTPIGVKQEHVQKAELEAGYTTLLKEFNQVDGIDAVTGQVVRPATIRPAGSPALDAITAGMELGAIDGLKSPWQLFVRGRGMFIAFAGTLGLLAICVVTVAGTPSDGDLSNLQGAALFIGVFDLVAVMTLLILGMMRIPSRYTESLGHELPDSHVYGGDLGDTDYLGELLGPDVVFLPDARPRLSDYLAFGETHLAAYSRHRTSMLPFLVIPRSRISQVVLTSIPQYRAKPNPAPVLTVIKDNGTSIDLTIDLARLNLNSTAKDLEPIAEWIVTWASAAHG
jgi:hypothetical protein